MTTKITEFETIQTLYTRLCKKNQERTINLSQFPTFSLVEFDSTDRQTTMPINRTLAWNFISFTSRSVGTTVGEIVNLLKEFVDDGRGSVPILLDNKLIKLKDVKCVQMGLTSSILFHETDMNPYQNTEFRGQLEKVVSTLNDSELTLQWLKAKTPKGLKVFCIIDSNEFYIGVDDLISKFPNVKPYIRILFRVTVDQIFVSKLPADQLKEFNDLKSDFDRGLAVAKLFGSDSKEVKHNCSDMDHFIGRIKEYLELNAKTKGQDKVQTADELFDFITINKDFLNSDRFKLLKLTIKNKLIEFNDDFRFPQAKDHYLKIFGEVMPGLE